jgi:hypothetical protein
MKNKAEEQLSEVDYCTLRDVLGDYLAEMTNLLDDKERSRLQKLHRRVGSFHFQMKRERERQEQREAQRYARQQKEAAEAAEAANRLVVARKSAKDNLLGMHPDEMTGPWIFLYRAFNGESLTLEEFTGINHGTWKSAVEEAARRWPDSLDERIPMNGVVRIVHGYSPEYYNPDFDKQ